MATLTSSQRKLLASFQQEHGVYRPMFIGAISMENGGRSFSMPTFMSLDVMGLIEVSEWDDHGNATWFRLTPKGEEEIGHGL